MFVSESNSDVFADLPYISMEKRELREGRISRVPLPLCAKSARSACGVGAHYPSGTPSFERRGLRYLFDRLPCDLQAELSEPPIVSMHQVYVKSISVYHAVALRFLALTYKFKSLKYMLFFSEAANAAQNWIVKSQALEIAQLGRQGHIFLLSSSLPSSSAHLASLPEQHPHQSALRRASLTSMTKILQPNLSISPRASRSYSPRLRGEESQEIWKRSHGASFLIYPDPSTTADTTDNPKAPCRSKEVGKEFLHKHDNFCRLRGTGEAKEIALRDRGLSNDGMSFVLNHGWSDTNGIRRVQSAFDVRRAKALTPYSSIDNVANILNFKPPPNEERPRAVEPHFHEDLPSKGMRVDSGVTAALNSTQNFQFDGHKIQPRVQFEGVEIAKKNQRSALFCESNEGMKYPVARVRPEAQKIAETHRGVDVKLLIAPLGRLEAPQSPLRRRLDPGGYKIALLSRGGSAKACINPGGIKRRPMRAVRNHCWRCFLEGLPGHAGSPTSVVACHSGLMRRTNWKAGRPFRKQSQIRLAWTHDSRV
ncbi:hypothetical protein TcWFU_007795 [Taenia crassiceps]|uniref:Uncharacterized protein n=1 Tax=Taenia crassiceps TaxID=6207 RepID=A0ABR4QEE3_9CEST